MPKTQKKPVTAVKKTAPMPASKALKKAGSVSAKPMLKSTKKAEPKVKLEVVNKKGNKKSEKLEIKATEVATGSVTEDEEEEIESPASGGASSGNLAMAAATAETAAGSLKNFRHHPDIENFYRFIYENDLRYEALEIIDRMAAQGLVMKSAKAARARAN